MIVLPPSAFNKGQKGEDIMAKKKIKKVGSISVTVQREDRLLAITNLSGAILEVAKALRAAPQITVQNCRFHGPFDDGTAVVIETEEEIDRTEIVTVDEGDTDGQD